jgi:Uma2 family endonuclease
MNATPVPRLLTAEEFFAKHEDHHAELVDGIVVWVDTVPSVRHGELCASIACEIGNFVIDNDLGRVCSNDTFVLTRRNPDCVRGPDVLFVSFSRMPKGRAPKGLSDIVPELAVEVMSPSNDWSKIFIKVGEYLQAGVLAVVVLDPESATASVYRKDELQQIFDNGDALVVPDVLPGFAVPVKKLFGL